MYHQLNFPLDLKMFVATLRHLHLRASVMGGKSEWKETVVVTLLKIRILFLQILQKHMT